MTSFSEYVARHQHYVRLYSSRYFFKKSFPTKYRMNINRNIREFVAFDDALFSTCKIRRTGKVGPRPWGGTQNPGPWGGTLE